MHDDAKWKLVIEPSLADESNPAGMYFVKEMNMDQLIVTIDGKDHKIGQGEHTICYLPVPHGSTREEKAKECKICFAEDKADAKA